MSFEPERRDITQFQNCPKYNRYELTEEQMLEIARMAVKLAEQKRNEEIGKMVTSKFYAALGAIVFAIWAWLTSHGYLK